MRGVLPIAIEAHNLGVEAVCVPRENAEGPRDGRLERVEVDVSRSMEQAPGNEANLSEVDGQSHAKRALEVAGPAGGPRVKVVRTTADRKGAKSVGRPHLLEALPFRQTALVDRGP